MQGITGKHRAKEAIHNEVLQMENKLLQMAIANGQAKIYYDTMYLIYPHKFLNTMVLDALLTSLKDEYNFYNIMGTIKAMPKD